MASNRSASRWEQSDEDDDDGQSSIAEQNESHGAVDDGLGPKFAQYMDSDEADEEDDEDDEDDEDESEEGEEEGEDGTGGAEGGSDVQERQIRRKMESIPFSTLVKARQSLGSGSEDGESDSEEDEFQVERGDGREEESRRRRHGEQALEKRDNKHAPTEMSSRRPVSRRRAVVETQNNGTRRDPRFSSLSASLPNSGLFRSSYGFLRDRQSDEVKQLKEAYGRLKRQEANHAGPKAKSAAAQSIREEKERVEMALRSAEGRENERRKREREGEVVKREKKVIKERIKEGGKPFYLKESAKKQLILKDKFDRLAGGQKGEEDGSSSRKDLKRAIERRRKKNAAKERREMPLGGGSMSRPEPGTTPKRLRPGGGASSDGTPKRKRGRRG